MKTRSLFIGILMLIGSVGVWADSKTDLETYFKDVSVKYELMTDSTYDDVAFTAAQQTSLKSVLDKVAAALAAGTADWGALLGELKDVYERVPYVEGGKRWWPITIADLKDGTKFMLECGPTNYRNRYMVAYPDQSNANAVMCNDEGKSTGAIWQLVATGAYDARYTAKPTYYLKDVTSGKYYGTATTLTSINQGDKRMVDNTEKAYPFCILTAGDIGKEEGVNINVYGNSDAVFLHHSNADGTWFRLSRFGAYKQVYYISTNSHSTNRDWQAWNLYTAEGSCDIAGELADAVKNYGRLVVPAGTEPGYFKESEVKAYNDALAAAKAITQTNTRQEIRNAIDSLAAAYEKAKALQPIPISEGYYRIVSANSAFVSAGKTICAYDRGDGFLGWHTMDDSKVENVFKITAIDGGWSVQNCATDQYVGVATNDNKVTTTANPSSVQIFTYKGQTEWTWKNATTNYTYYTFGGGDQGYMGRYYYQKDLGAFDSWVFESVDEEWVKSATITPARDSLNTYYQYQLTEVAPYVNTADYEADNVEAYNTAMDNAKAGLNNSTLSANELKVLLASLKETYAALGFARGGGFKIVDRLSWEDIKDGSTIAIEAASTPKLQNNFLKGQTQYRHELYAWVFKEGFNKDAVWVVEKAPFIDKKNKKATYYLKQQSTGLYIGKNGTGTNAYQTRALVETTDSAYNFSIVPPSEAGCTDYRGVRNWDENSATFQFANTPTQAFNLCNWEGSPTFVWLLEGSTDVIAWNVYRVELTADLAEEYAKLMERCEAFQPEVTDGWGFYNSELVQKYMEAYNVAKSLTKNSSRSEYRQAIDALDEAYFNVRNSGTTPVQSGYYYVTNRYADYVTNNNGEAGMYVDEDSKTVKFGLLNKESGKNVFHVTGNNGSWYLQNVLSGRFITSTDNKALTLSDERGKSFDINLSGTYKVNLKLSEGSTYYGIDSNAEGAVNGQTDGTAEACLWTFVKLSDEEIQAVTTTSAKNKLLKTLEEVTPCYETLGNGKYVVGYENSFKTAYLKASEIAKSSTSTQADFEGIYKELSSAFKELKANRIYPEGSAIEKLAHYVASIAEDVPHVSAKYYDAAASAQLHTLYNNAVEAIEKENLDEAGYADLLEKLKVAYDAVGYVPGGYYPRASVADLKDGDLIMLEGASSEYTLGTYLKQGDVLVGNNSTVYTNGRDESCVWRLVDAGKLDFMNNKTTYYLQNVKSQLYMGYAGSYKDKAMVDDIGKAMNFSILSQPEISFMNYLDGTHGYDDGSVSFQFSYSKSEFVRLGNFIAYGDYVFPVTESSWQHVIAWNVYSAVLEDDIVGEYKEAMQAYGKLRVESGDAPGCYSEELAKKYADALAFAKTAEGSKERRTYRLAIDSLKAVYEMVMNANAKEITEGNYYIVSNFSPFLTQKHTMGVYAANNQLGWQEMDKMDPRYIFTFTKGTNGGWIIQNFATKRYVASDNGSAVGLVNSANVEQLFNYIGGGQFNWNNASSLKTYYPNNYSGTRGYVRTDNPKNTIGGADAWQLMRVSSDIIDSIEMESKAKLVNKTLIVEGKTRINWIKAQARMVGQLNILAIDTRKAELNDDVTYESLTSVSPNENCLYYVASNQNIKGTNVINGGKCEDLRLVDALFYCPEAFTATKATYRLNPKYATKTGGWQTLAIPFKVSKVNASVSGRVEMETETQAGGIFIRQFSGIENEVINFTKLAEEGMSAYTPYAIAVPGEEYGNKSIEGQTLSFEGENVEVKTTLGNYAVRQGNYSFVPTYENGPVHKAWIINYHGNGFDSWTYGSPLCFRAYFTSVDSAEYEKGPFSFSIDSETSGLSKKLLRISGLSLEEVTGIEHNQVGDVEYKTISGGIEVNAGRTYDVVVYDTAGRLFVKKTVSGHAIINLPKGIYLINNKKVIIK